MRQNLEKLNGGRFVRVGTVFGVTTRWFLMECILRLSWFRKIPVTGERRVSGSHVG